jgi:glycosyltransferase involved in cell wall biosynthesis
MDSRDHMRATVIVPAHNEAESLPIVLKELEQLGQDIEIVVVDDGSTDDTANIAATYRCRILRHDSNKGKAEAIRTGIAAASSEKVIFIDADNTYPTAAIPQLIEALDKHDLVTGRRMFSKENIRLTNRVGNWLFSTAIKRLYGFQPNDPLTGLYGLRRTIALQMRLDSEGFGIETEMCAKAAAMHLSTLEIPIAYRERVGESKLRPFRDGYLILRTLGGLLPFYNPTVLFVLPGLCLMLLCFVLGSYLYFDNIRIGEAGFSQTGLLVAAMGSLAGFQILLFGSIANLYAVAHKFTRPDRLTRLLLWKHLGTITLILGFVLATFALAVGLVLYFDWASKGYGPFLAEKEAIVATVAGIYGIELIFSSIFVGQLAREVRHLLRLAALERALAREISGEPVGGTETASTGSPRTTGAKV